MPLPFLEKATTLLDDVDTWTVQSGLDEAGAGRRLEDGLGAVLTLLLPCEAARALVHFGGGNLASLSARDRAILIAHGGGAEHRARSPAFFLASLPDAPQPSAALDKSGAPFQIDAPAERPVPQ